MKQTIVVAGGTGNLGELIVKALIKRGAVVRAVVRRETEPEKIEKMEKLGAEIVEVEMSNAEELAIAFQGASCVVSAIQGVREVIVDGQSALLEAAIAANVPRFIPSDYSIDFTKFPKGENRNLDWRREFHTILDKSPIASTSVLNGAFSYMLTSVNIILDAKAKRVHYWENPDQPMDFTTVENAADFTASAALDNAAPKVLRISGSRLTARQLADTAGEVTGTEFELINLGSLEDLTVKIKRERVANTQSDEEVYPLWQGNQYLYNMFQGLGLLEPLDNDRYSGMNWTSVREVLANVNY